MPNSVLPSNFYQIGVLGDSALFSVPLLRESFRMIADGGYPAFKTSLETHLAPWTPAVPRPDYSTREFILSEKEPRKPLHKARKLPPSRTAGADPHGSLSATHKRLAPIPPRTDGTAAALANRQIQIKATRIPRPRIQLTSLRRKYRLQNFKMMNSIPQLGTAIRLRKSASSSGELVLPQSPPPSVAPSNPPHIPEIPNGPTALSSSPENTATLPTTPPRSVPQFANVTRDLAVLPRSPVISEPAEFNNLTPLLPPVYLLANEIDYGLSNLRHPLSSITLKQFIAMCLCARQSGRHTKSRSSKHRWRLGRTIRTPDTPIPQVLDVTHSRDILGMEPGRHSLYYTNIFLPVFQMEGFPAEPNRQASNHKVCVHGCTRNGRRQWISGTKFLSPLTIRFYSSLTKYRNQRCHLMPGRCPAQHPFFAEKDLNREFILDEDDLIVLYYRFVPF